MPYSAAAGEVEVCPARSPCPGQVVAFLVRLCQWKVLVVVVFFGDNKIIVVVVGDDHQESKMLPANRL